MKSIKQSVLLVTALLATSVTQGQVTYNMLKEKHANQKRVGTPSLFE